MYQYNLPHPYLLFNIEKGHKDHKRVSRRLKYKIGFKKVLSQNPYKPKYAQLSNLKSVSMPKTTAFYFNKMHVFNEQ